MFPFVKGWSVEDLGTILIDGKAYWVTRHSRGDVEFVTKLPRDWRKLTDEEMRYLLDDTAHKIITTVTGAKDLKPCPFCGGAVELSYEGSSDWAADCECGVRVVFTIRGRDEPAETAEKWNTRVS